MSSARASERLKPKHSQGDVVPELNVLIVLSPKINHCTVLARAIASRRVAAAIGMIYTMPSDCLHGGGNGSCPFYDQMECATKACARKSHREQRSVACSRVYNFYFALGRFSWCERMLTDFEELRERIVCAPDEDFPLTPKQSCYPDRVPCPVSHSAATSPQA